MCDEGLGRAGRYSHLQKLIQVYMCQRDKLRKKKKLNQIGQRKSELDMETHIF